MPCSNKRFVIWRPVEPCGPPAAPVTKIGFVMSPPFHGVSDLHPTPDYRMMIIILWIQAFLVRASWDDFPHPINVMRYRPEHKAEPIRRSWRMPRGASAPGGLMEPESLR